MRHVCALLLGSGLLLTACGGSKGSPTTPTTSTSTSTPAAPILSQARADTVADAVNLAILQALLALSEALESLPAAKPAGLARPQAVTVAPPIHHEQACPGGGVSSLNGTSTLTEHDDGKIDLDMDLRVGFVDCAWPGVTLHGDPHLTLTMLMSGTVEAPTRMTLHIKDAVAFTVDGFRGRVQYNCTQVLDLSSKAPEISGSIAWEYPVGTRVTGPGCSD